MEIVIALLCLAVGAALGWFIAQSRSATLAERARLATEQLAKTDAELLTLRARATELETERGALKEAQSKLLESFKALSADALRSNNQSFLELARESFGKLHQQSADELGKRQLAIDAMVKPLKESLEKVDSKIGEMEKTRATAYGSLTEQLKGLATTNATLQSETTKLSRSLRSTSTAGRWGEIQLQRVVELAGMLENVDFIQQEGVGDFRPDLVVRLPGGKSIAVDAKAPMQAYLEALEASDENVRKAKFIEHARVVRGHIDALGAKSYWKAIQPAPEFVVLFIPGEAFYSAALRYEPDLFERGANAGVILASPASLIAVLKAAAYGWKQEVLSKNTEEIRKLGLELHERLATLAENFDLVGQRLTQAVTAYNSAVTSVEGRLLVTGRKLVKLGAGTEKKLGEPRLVEELPKQLSAPELTSPTKDNSRLS
ncbi:DNA recombination protein RmuC [Oleiharenicola lentus]|uniref:DNA recombination protein RmuC n=1 Tax=Oleiharenicola lentus TaxID=2508720 RepID=UPI003F67ADC3